MLIDTSVWIDFFRGKTPGADVVTTLLEDGTAATAGPIVLELMRGITREKDRQAVARGLEGCELLSMPDRLWEQSGEIGALVARKGVEIKSMDLLIATYAITHRVPIVTSDRDFTLLARAGIPIHVSAP